MSVFAWQRSADTIALDKPVDIGLFEKDISPDFIPRQFAAGFESFEEVDSHSEVFRCFAHGEPHLLSLLDLSGGDACAPWHRVRSVVGRCHDCEI